MTSIMTSPRLWRTALGISLFAIIALLASTSAAHAAPSADAPTITSPDTVEQGDTFSVDVQLPASAEVFAYDVTVTYAAEYVQYVDDSATGPDGGFSSVSESDGSVTFSHTRLGSSPTLNGDLSLVSLDFLAVSAGNADFALESVTLVDAVNDALALTPTAVVTTEVTAAAGPAPTTSPTPGPDDSTPDEGSEPEEAATETPGLSDNPPSTDLGSSGSDTGSLSSTGASPLPMIAIALAAILLGCALMVRKKVMSR